MTVKQELLQWIITHKNEVQDDAESYVTFRAGEAAADIGTHINNVSKALSILRDEGLVVNPAHGQWAWTGGVPVESEKPARSPRKAKPKDSMANAIDTLWSAVLDVRQMRVKAEENVTEAHLAFEAASMRVQILRTEEDALTAAYNVLKKDEEEA